MFNYKKNYPKIIRFKVKSNLLLLESKDRFQIEAINENKILKKGNVAVLNFIKSAHHFYFIANYTQLLNQDLQPIYENYKIRTFLNERYALLYQLKKNGYESENEFLLDVVEGTIRFQMNEQVRYACIEKEVLYVEHFDINRGQVSSIAAYAIHTGQQIWCKPLHGTQLLGVYQNTLWVGLHEGILLGIDIQTGQTQTSIEAIPALQQGFLDQSSGQIIHFHMGIYYALDLKTLQVKTQDLAAQMATEPYFSVLQDFDEYFLYYISSYKHWIGAIDRKSLKIVWQYDFKKELHAHPIKLRKAHRKLYVSDSKHILHVFEVDPNN